MVVRLAIGQGLQIDIPKARTQHGFSRRCREVVRVSAQGVIGMRVCDDSSVDGLPRIDIEVADGTIEALGTLNDQIGVHEINRGMHPSLPAQIVMQDGRFPETPVGIEKGLR